MARGGLGLCMLASWLVDDDIEEGRLVHVLESYAPPPAPICALTPPGRHLPAATRVFLEHLRAEISSRLVQDVRPSRADGPRTAKSKP